MFSFLESLKILNRLLEVTERVIKLFQSKEINEWLNEVEAAIDEMERAKTQDEKFNAARTMVKLIRDLR